MPAGSPPQPPPPPPTLYEWAGGMPAIERLMDSFYRKVRQDAVLGPLFAHMSEDHPRHVAHFIAEVLGVPPSTPTRPCRSGGGVCPAGHTAAEPWNCDRSAHPTMPFSAPSSNRRTFGNLSAPCRCPMRSILTTCSRSSRVGRVWESPDSS